jgi:hypothetical protein
MKTKLIALVALTAGAVAGVDVDLTEGDAFEVDAEVAEALLTDGKAALASPPPASTGGSTKTKTVKARLLVVCEHGNPNDLVELPEAVAKALAKEGFADTDKAAVAYATGLEQNKPKKA